MLRCVCVCARTAFGILLFVPLVAFVSMFLRLRLDRTRKSNLSRSSTKAGGALDGAGGGVAGDSESARDAEAADAARRPVSTVAIELVAADAPST